MDKHDKIEANQESDAAPDRGSSGDVSTTGHSAHDTHDASGAHDAAGHGTDTSDVPTLVPTGLAQLILPALILILVVILLAGPVMNAFSAKPQAGGSTGGEGTAATGAGSSGPETTATPLESEVKVSPTQASATFTAVPATPPPATPTTAGQNPPLGATQTAVALAGERGEVARVPVKLELSGASFDVKPGNDLLPDWKPSADENSATWIANTVANHIMYVPYSDAHQALFAGVKPGDIVKLTMNTGQVFTFSVTRSARAANGPAQTQGQFTVATAMAQDHAGVTIFLTGDPAPDRAVVQADFTGNIQ